MEGEGAAGSLSKILFSTTGSGSLIRAGSGALATGSIGWWPMELGTAGAMGVEKMGEAIAGILIGGSSSVTEAAFAMLSSTFASIVLAPSSANPTPAGTKAWTDSKISSRTLI